MPAPILIVEDDTDINNMMAEALTKAGYACTQAFSGTEGLLYLDQGHYALVILDLMLPGLEGEALLPQIKAKTGTPVLVVSAKDSLDSKVGLLTAGAEDYLTKPFAIQELALYLDTHREDREALEFMHGSVRFFRIVDHAHEGEVQTWEQRSADQSTPGFIFRRFLLLERNVGIG